MTAYGGGRGRTLFDRDAPAPSRPRSDRRYHTSKWRRTSKAVLVRDGYRCMIDERCPHIARVVDHIRPVYPGMPDAGRAIHQTLQTDGPSVAHSRQRIQVSGCAGLWSGPPKVTAQYGGGPRVVVLRAGTEVDEGADSERRADPRQSDNGLER